MNNDEDPSMNTAWDALQDNSLDSRVLESVS